MWLFGLVAILACTTIRCAAYDHARNAALYGCAASIHAALDREHPQLAVSAASNKDWTPLGQADAQQVVTALSRSNSLDCSKWMKDGLLVDAWGNPVRIAVRGGSSADSPETYRVWFPGPDRVDGTGDDVASP